MTIARPKLRPLRAGILNPQFWRGLNSKAGPGKGWGRIRRDILARDKHRCLHCRHAAEKWMTVHHVLRGNDHSRRNLATLCTACHAVLHLGLNMSFGGLEVWRSPLSQVTIVRRTRAGIAEGKSLREINATLRLRPGHYPPHSMLYARDLIRSVGRRYRAELKPPLVAVFVRFSRWQLDDPPAT